MLDGNICLQETWMDTSVSKSRLYAELHDEIILCTKCPLCMHRQNAVVDRGTIDATMMVICESPGKMEDIKGKALVGQSGRLIDKLIKKAGIKSSDVIFTNVIHCRPAGNKFPDKPEIPSLCVKYTQRQLAIVKPRIVIVSGKQATQWILLDGRPLGTLRSVVGHTYKHTSYVYVEQFHVMYHPAFLLRANDETLEERMLKILKSAQSGLYSSGPLIADTMVGPQPKQGSLF